MPLLCSPNEVSRSPHFSSEINLWRPFAMRRVPLFQSPLFYAILTVPTSTCYQGGCNLTEKNHQFRTWQIRYNIVKEDFETHRVISLFNTDFYTTWCQGHENVLIGQDYRTPHGEVTHLPGTMME